MRTFRFGTLLSIAFGITACASFSADSGMSGVNAVVAPALGGDALKVSNDESGAAALTQTRRLLKLPLSADAAVRVALLNNRGLQADYNELGIAEATMVESSLPPNPTFTLSGVSTPVELDIEGRIAADILALATLPARSEIAAVRFREAQLRAAEATLRLGAQTRRNYYRAVGAVQSVAALTQAVAAAKTSSELAMQLVSTGAMNKLDDAREEAFYADLVIQLTTARERATASREQLSRSLGLANEIIVVKLPATLPALPTRLPSVTAFEMAALQKRVDLQIARIELDALAKSYGLTKATRFINLLDVSGVSRAQREAGGNRGVGGGAEASFQIPIFDLGEVRLRQANEAYTQAVNRLAQKAVEVRSEAREAYQTYRSSYQIADHYRTDILPLRKTIADETLLRYDAMQIDVFSLLTEAQRRIAATVAGIDAQRNFWVARAQLDAAIYGGGISDSSTSQPAANATQPTASE